MPAGRTRGLGPRLALTALAVCAWLLLWGWSTSPWGRYLEHGDWLGPAPVGELCRAIPGGELLVPALLHASAWVVMVAAMMLPTIAPLVDRFARIVAPRDDRRRLEVALAVGYLLAWCAFGLLAHGADRLVLETLYRIPGWTRHGWMLGAATLAAAGAFQFSRLKYRCLEQCRTPTSFIVEHWHGRTPLRDALVLGVRHGAFCIGCCWALMMLMFVVGTGNLGWMLALGGVMAAEKNAAWGRRLSEPLGWSLLVAAVGVVVVRAA